MPPAKYQLAAVVLWHGASDQPDEPCTAWETARPPPATVTVSDSHVPDDRAGMDGASTAEAGTATAACTEAPVSLTAVMSPVTCLAVVLVRTRKPGEIPEPVDCPVQYQADDSASGASTSALGVTGAPAGAGVLWVPAATPTPTTAARTTSSTRQRRSRLTWAGLTGAPLPLLRRPRRQRRRSPA